MRYEDLFDLLDEAKLSPEKAAARLGVSNMTLRRWRRRPGKDEVPEVYARAFEPALRLLADEGLVQRGSAAVLQAGRQEDFRETLTRLGFPADILTSGPGLDRRKMVSGLSAIGADVKRKEEVDHSRKAIAAFKKWGADWKERIAGMLKVIDSAELTAMDKLVAYGALFYLISPFDLIPDAIPVIGYLDDFAILGIALWYYRRRFPRLFGGSPSKKGTK